MEPKYHPGDVVLFTGWPSDIPRSPVHNNHMPDTDACYVDVMDNMIGHEFVINKVRLVPGRIYGKKDHYRYYFQDSDFECNGCYFVEEWFQPACGVPDVTVEDLL